MKRSRSLWLFSFLLFIAPAFHATVTAQEPVTLIELSQKLLLRAKQHEPVDSLTTILGQINDSTLLSQLRDDDHKKAFWINLYNAYTQLLLSNNPGRYRKRNAFFSSREIRVAGRFLSLDDIEHGILRRSKIKWSLGYLSKWFPSAFERKHRVDTLDYRIHFTLNCGATSCPPIAFYSPQLLNKQLQTATRVYLRGESELQETADKIYLPAMMGWFRADFGGKKRMKELLHKLEILTNTQDPVIRFKKYDWHLFLANYKTSNDG